MDFNEFLIGLDARGELETILDEIRKARMANLNNLSTVPLDLVQSLQGRVQAFDQVLQLLTPTEDK